MARKPSSACQRHYSFSDRIRYYWNQPEAEAAVARLTNALRGKTVPLTLFRQHLPAFESFAGKPLDPERAAAQPRSSAAWTTTASPARAKRSTAENNATDGGRK